jgi:hypothetical protein
MLMLIVEMLKHGPLLVRYSRVVEPDVRPVIVGFGIEVLLKNPGPEIILQVPAPTDGGVAFNTVLPVLAQTVWLGPA